MTGRRCLLIGGAGVLVWLGWPGPFLEYRRYRRRLLAEVEGLRVWSALAMGQSAPSTRVAGPGSSG